jgi:hypothetical protein
VAARSGRYTQSRLTRRKSSRASVRRPASKGAPLTTIVRRASRSGIPR